MPSYLLARARHRSTFAFPIALALLALGVGLRLVWLFLHPGELAPGEAMNVAAHFAREGTLADPYGEPSGPTAHLLPIPLLIGGAVYRAFGIASPASELILSLISIGLVTAGFALFYAAFRRMGASPTACLLALAALCLLPFNLWLEVVAFRLWEGALAVALAGAYLLALIELDGTDEPSIRSMILLAAANGLLFFISPQLGVGAYAASGYFLMRNVRPARWPLATLIAALALAAFLVPWSIRNQQAMGEALPLRSNFGLELAIGFNPAAVEAADPYAAFQNRLRELHPFSSAGARQRLHAAGGELPYFKALADQTKSWIADHPTLAMRLAARHLADYLFPPSWLWLGADRSGSMVVLQMAIAWSVSLLGLLGVLTRLTANARFRYAAIIMAATILPYMLVQPILRYRYLVFAMLVFFAADLVVRAVRRWRPADRVFERVDAWLSTSRSERAEARVTG
ncbi:MAG: hypothetical protein JWN69_2403 [Alphaproteobacteria bacterium]|nr:hypothetical protein [Alphaproteobacteria bacterium]